MSAEEVLKLSDIGFTIDEIRGMMKEDAPEEPPTNDDSTPNDPPVHDDISKGGDQGANLSELTETIKELKDTVKDMQAANINKAKGGKSDYEKSISDTIKSFMDTL